MIAHPAAERNDTIATTFLLAEAVTDTVDAPKKKKTEGLPEDGEPTETPRTAFEHAFPKVFRTLRRLTHNENPGTSDDSRG